MILFFGTRPGKRKETRLGGLSCPHCRQRDTLVATVIPHFVHIFWLPVYRLKPFLSVECTHCKRVYLRGEFNADMQARIGEIA